MFRSWSLRLTVLAMHRHDAFAELAPSAASRTRTLEPDDPKYLLWLSVWIQLDAAAALDFLEEPARAHTLDRTVEHLCAILGGRRIGHQPLVQGPDYLAPIHLHRLIPLIYRHVRPAEDLDHWERGLHSDSPGRGTGFPQRTLGPACSKRWCRGGRCPLRIGG